LLKKNLLHVDTFKNLFIKFNFVTLCQFVDVIDLDSECKLDHLSGKFDQFFFLRVSKFILIFIGLQSLLRCIDILEKNISGVLGYQIEREFVSLHNEIAGKAEVLYERNKENEVGAVLELLFKDLKIIVFEKKKNAHDDVIKDLSVMMKEIKHQILVDMTKAVDAQIKQEFSLCKGCISADESEPSLDISTQLFSLFPNEGKHIKDWSKVLPKD